jgi:hypothetical protein
MRSVVFGFLGLLALQAPAMAASNGACDAVASDWRAAGFASPAKPAQARVLGHAGYEVSGPQYQQMMGAIRAACQAGDQATAVQQAATAEALLHRAKDGV